MKSLVETLNENIIVESDETRVLNDILPAKTIDAVTKSIFGSDWKTFRKSDRWEITTENASKTATWIDPDFQILKNTGKIIKS